MIERKRGEMRSGGPTAQNHGAGDAA